MNDLHNKVAMLYELSADGDESAVAELDALVCNDPKARRVLLDIAWVAAQIPLATALHPCERSPEDHAVASISQLGGQRFRQFLIAASALLAVTLFTLVAVSRFGNVDEQLVAHSKTPAASAGEVIEQDSVDITQLEDASYHGNVSNNAAHPPKRGGLKGGIVVNDDPLPEFVSFNFHVRPILSENCYYCHGPDPNHRQADLRLDEMEGAQSVIEVGSPEDSELVARILDTDPDSQMPPPESGRVVSERQKQILQRWIEQGAQYETHWAYSRVERPDVPDVGNKAWINNPIDSFILSTLESKGIKPSPRANPGTLVRRLYLDLTGLPPTPQASRRFLAAYESDSKAAVESLVDELMASDHYGERMALPWLDAARYSDSNGFQQDGDRTQWPWRDWVVDALNENKPFDQFTIEQLAGDLLPDPTQDQLIATAFNRNHMLNGEGGAIAEEQRNNYVFDRVDTTATTWLGLTMACAQCHDHKYDPITQEDYYQFFAYFNSVDENGGVNVRNGRLQYGNPVLELPTDEQTEQLEKLEVESESVKQALADADQAITEAMELWVAENRENPPSMGRDIFNAVKKTPDERNGYERRILKNWYLLNVAKKEWKQLQESSNAFESRRKKIKSTVTSVMIMRDKKKPRKTNIFDRGVYDSPLAEVLPNTPHFLPPLPGGAEANRLALANWLVDRENPLTSRVTVNRYWQTFFGTGIVKTAEDFGVQSELPSHPELLDWLAVEFMESGWDVKHIHRLIVTSETYLQSSRDPG